MPSLCILSYTIFAFASFQVLSLGEFNAPAIKLGSHNLNFVSPIDQTSRFLSYPPPDFIVIDIDEFTPLSISDRQSEGAPLKPPNYASIPVHPTTSTI
jgi:hypothetical protein